ncbi:MAG: hypothetical protein NZ920_05280 [Aigarchaeota archaeon]|nr:hypothetical protein [Aigarchaeota archaeon]MDW8092892.1 hypothetical protein [Nitrososphaerota archaeon]
MRVRCHICRELRGVVKYETRGDRVLVVCDRGHEQFISARDMKKLITRE